MLRITHGRLKGQLVFFCCKFCHFAVPYRMEVGSSVDFIVSCQGVLLLDSKKFTNERFFTALLGSDYNFAKRKLCAS